MVTMDSCGHRYFFPQVDNGVCFVVCAGENWISAAMILMHGRKWHGEREMGVGEGREERRNLLEE